jgi:hypothetical protein
MSKFGILGASEFLLMSGPIRARSARVSLSNLTPAHKSQHSVCTIYFTSSLKKINPSSSSENVLAEGKVQVMEAQQDGDIMVKSRVLEGGQNLDLKVARLR